MKAELTIAAAALGAAGFAASPAISGCSSGNKGPACNPCDSTGATTAAPTGHDANPDGVAYPNPPGGFGKNARVGSTPGSIMANFKFLGYPNLPDRSQGLQTVALADYYDPCGKRYKLLHVTAAGIWCVYCNQETDEVVADKQALAAKGVVVLQTLSEGKVPNQASTPQDLDSWVTQHKVNFPEVLDPGEHNFGGYFIAAAMPWNCDIDPRTMEIISSSVGLETDVSAGLQAVPVNPSTPSPVACN